MRCAVVENATSTVTNVIVAAVTDAPPDGCFLVELSDAEPCGFGWMLSSGEFLPPAEAEPV